MNIEQSIEHIRRPKHLIAVLGTHTEVGKTFVTSRWLAHLRTQGLRVAARKPVQSFAISDTTTDAAQLAAATGETSNEVCASHRNYPLALAPPMAADLLHQPRITMSDLIAEITWPTDIDVGVVETVGGPRSPIAHDGDSIDLAHRLQPDSILLVADAGLGTLNAVRLSLACIQSLKMTATITANVTVYLNRYDATIELHRLNRQWLTDRYGIETAIDIAAITFR